MAVIIIFLQISRPSITLRSAAKQLDIFGILSIGVATVLFLLAFEWASQGVPWSSAQVLTCLILAIVAMGVFSFVETKSTKPVIPLRFFTHPTRIGSYGSTFMHAMAYSGLNYYTPLYFQGVRMQSASESGVSLLPLVLAFAIVSTGSGYFITATKRFVHDA